MKFSIYEIFHIWNFPYMKLFISYMKNVVTYELKKNHMWNYSCHIWNLAFHMWISVPHENLHFTYWILHSIHQIIYSICEKCCHIWIEEKSYVKLFRSHEIRHFICEFRFHIWNSSFHILNPWFHIWNSNFICELTYEIFIRAGA